ncbi:LysR family transcriptional regulator [Bacillus sp. TH13]|uniref:LysR family transcriptional regulator n=1 Tax=Bacillus sp. TH13 TaxID=2796379 RepID=UPI00191204A0|nr:LysR family transcriptional regulator [Bacillus sp. TH13]MBK5491721.1 LysR family transcriptional regulator [Bacillus sp. TH13]
MNFDQLKILISLAQERQFSKTAKKLYITPSAVSQSITNLEKELGVTLFHRTRLSTYPTTDGQYMIRKAHVILQKQREMYEYIQDKRHVRSLKIKIGSIPGMVNQFVDLLPTLQQNFPFLEVDIREFNTQDLLKELREEKLDYACMGFTDSLTNYHLSYNLTKLIGGAFYFAVNRQSPLVIHDVLTYKQVIQQPLAVYPDNFMVNFVSHMENKANNSANVLFTTNNMNTIVKSVCENMVVTFGPYYLLSQAFSQDNQRIKLIPIENDPEILQTFLWLICSRDTSLTVLSQTMLTLMKEKLCLF